MNSLEDILKQNMSWDDVKSKLKTDKLVYNEEFDVYEINDSDILNQDYDKYYLQFIDNKLNKIIYNKVLSIEELFRLQEIIDNEIVILRRKYSDNVLYEAPQLSSLIINELEERPFLITTITAPNNNIYQICITRKNKQLFLSKIVNFDEEYLEKIEKLDDIEKNVTEDEDTLIESTKGDEVLGDISEEIGSDDMGNEILTESEEELESTDEEEVEESETDNLEVKEKDSKKKKNDKLWISLIIGSILELGFYLYFSWSLFFNSESNNIIYLVLSVIFYFVAIFVPFWVFTRFNIFKNNIPEIKDFLSTPSKNKKINDLINSYKTTFINEETGFPNYKTRANADLYFNLDTVMGSLAPKYPVNKALKLIGSSFIGLGILGTFIGFSVAMNSLSFGSPEEMLEGIKQLVESGLNTAFNTSIVGVMCSLFYNFLIFNPLLHETKQYFEKLCDDLDQEYYISETEALMQYTMTTDVNGEAIPFSDSLNLILSNMSAQTQALKDFNDDLSIKLSNINQSVNSSMKDFFGEDIKAQVVESIHSNLEELETALVTASTQLNEASDSVEKTVDKIDNEVANSIESFNDALISALDNCKDAANHIEKVPEKMSGISSALESAGDKLSSVSDTVATNMDLVKDNFKTLFNDIQNTQNSVSEILSKVQVNEEYSGRNLEGLTHETNEILNGFRKVDVSLSNIFEKISEEIANYNTTVSGTLSDYLTQFASASKNFSSTIYSTVDDFNNSMLNVNNTLKSIENNSGKFDVSIKHLEKTLNKSDK